MPDTLSREERIDWWTKALASRNGSNRGMAEFVVAHIDALTAAVEPAIARLAVGDPEYPLSRVLAIFRGEE